MSKITESMKAIFCQGLPERDIKNANKVNLLAFLWAFSLGISVWCASEGWLDNIAALVALFSINCFIGVAMIVNFRRFLIELDDLERKIQLDALALSVGITVIWFSSGSILSLAGVIDNIEPSSLIVTISLSYIVGIVVGRVKYR